LPILNIKLKASKPDKKPYPKELITYGDHLRQKRLELNLSQPQVAKMIQVETDSITNWELNRNNPSLPYIPKIISFLGYIPESKEHPIKQYRMQKGMTQKELARLLNIDPTTLARVEKGEKKIMAKIKAKIDKLLNTE